MRSFQIMFVTAVVTLLLLIVFAGPVRSEVSTNNEQHCDFVARNVLKVGEARDEGRHPAELFLILTENNVPPNIAGSMLQVVYSVFPNTEPSKIAMMVFKQCLDSSKKDL